MTTKAATSIPILKGDGAGNYRIHVIGNSGVGKASFFISTLAAELADIIGIPHIALDTVYWKPNWMPISEDILQETVRTAMEQDPRGWVIDGNYERVLGDIIDPLATDIIWLDPPLSIYFPRLCIRTLGRLMGVTPPCSPGCPERARETFFSRNSILWWCLSRHWELRRRGSALMARDGIHLGGKTRRLGGWYGESADFLRSVRQMIRRE